MAWTVTVSNKAEKGLKRLPLAVQKALVLLMQDMQEGGLVRGDWPNYSKLGTGRHHCHIRKGRAYQCGLEDRKEVTRTTFEKLAKDHGGLSQTALERLRTALPGVAKTTPGASRQ